MADHDILARALGKAVRDASIKFTLEATYTYGGNAVSVSVVGTRFLKMVVQEVGAQLLPIERKAFEEVALKRVTRREFDKLKAEYVGKSIVDATKEKPRGRS